jgi:dTMP kinase
VTTGAGAGRLIVFEGGEGSGKSTQLQRLSARLDRTGVRHISLREPGGTQIGSEVRRVLLDRASDIDPRAEALLFMASRAQLVQREIRPALQRGDVVLLDRFFLSTYAYQIAGHGLPEADVRNANQFATGGLVPTITILLAFPAAEGLARAAKRAASHDRMEAMGAAFHERVANALNTFAQPSWQADHPECGPIVAVDAHGSEDEVELRVTAVLRAAWPDL